MITRESLTIPNPRWPGDRVRAALGDGKTPAEVAADACAAAARRAAGVAEARAQLNHLAELHS